ncbi:two-component system, OmpR family, sensor histidine kinase MtrB [Lentzea fradiae]|uniref:histidine kinase n=1 Tax=Lentzea fradiae TaxID=200378 RepID=A0A1G7UKT3_9PSEU|nr:HAMP domain-containing sensor histidine kinase [Lentzea fradiae]SDG48126.1 two-component system, OmpR family, sensor histidine kinase MtrB [Lentzea fradiae]
MSRPAGRRWRAGLRPRLLAAFVAVTVLGAAAAAWSGAGSASAALVDSAQRRLTETVTSQIAAVTPGLTYPPGQDALELLRTAVSPNAVVTYRDLRAADGADLTTDALREAVRTGGRLVSQRIDDGDRPWLLIGTPVMITAVDGTRTPSGIEVYVARDLTPVGTEIAGMTRSAALTAALALPLAVLLALLAASSVLRPVRDLRDTARRLAAGDLDARSRPRGSDELAELTATVNEMAGSVQSSMAAMRRMQADARRFAADVSHELRTPLSTLTAVVEVLSMTADRMEPDARESARLAITETQRLVTLVEDLMEVSRFDAGTAELRLEDVDVPTAVRQCLRARSWLGRVELRTPPALVARLDRRRLDVVVANLVGNALRHGAPPVRVTVTGTGHEVRIEVADHGPGIPERVLPHVFDRFYKADAARTRTPGSGLGLAIALENARLHGGDITAANRPSGGARFLLRLPGEGDG